MISATNFSGYTLEAHVENAILTNKINFSLFGNFSNNKLTGNAAVNFLVGADGHDALYGLAGIDTIKDFDNAYIELSLSVFTSLTGNVGDNLNADQLRVGNYTSAQDADDYIIYNNVTGALYYDADGLGGVAAKQFAIVQDTGGGASVTLNIFNDFVLGA